jgi:hypothetical protein
LVLLVIHVSVLLSSKAKSLSKHPQHHVGTDNSMDLTHTLQAGQRPLTSSHLHPVPVCNPRDTWLPNGPSLAILPNPQACLRTLRQVPKAPGAGHMGLDFRAPGGYPQFTAPLTPCSEHKALLRNRIRTPLSGWQQPPLSCLFGFLATHLCLHLPSGQALPRAGVRCPIHHLMPVSNT